MYVYITSSALGGRSTERRPPLHEEWCGLTWFDAQSLLEQLTKQLDLALAAHQDITESGR
jgi:hypothetical protein